MSVDDAAARTEQVPSLVGRTFSIVEIGGAPVLEGTAPEMAFGDDGRVTGRATINRMFGPYALDGDTLRLGPMASTMMAGLPAAMEQEHRLLSLLGTPLRIRAGTAAGEVVLDDGQSTLLLREVSPETVL